MRRGCRGLLATAIVGVLVGCGGDDKASSPPPTATSKPAAGNANQALAHQANLRLSDFPPGWREGPNRSANTNTCPAYLAARRTALVRDVSSSFSKDNANADSSIQVYDSPARAHASFAGLNSPIFLACLRTEAEKTITADSRGQPISGLVTGRLSTRRFGQETAAFEISGQVKSNVTVSFYADLYVVRQGRALAFLRFINVLSPFDQQLRARLLTAVARRTQGV